MKRLITAAAAAVGVLALAAGPAQAVTEGRIDSVVADGDQLSILFSVTSLEPGQTIDPASVQVAVEGQPVRSQAEAFDSAAGQQRAAVLTLDVSGSMKGEGIAGAKAAADSFLSSVPDDVRVGLVTFGDSAKVVIPPTTDHARVAETVEGLQVGGDTALYDGVVAATKSAGKDGSRSVIVLSDGKDEGSKATLAQAKTAVSGSGVGLDAVALGRGGKQAAAALAQLAAAGNGQVFGARETADLEAAFAASAAALDSQLQITAQIPAGVDESVSVAVSAQSGDTAVSDATVALVDTAAPVAGAGADADTATGPAAVAVSPMLTAMANPAVVLAALILVFAGLGVLLIFAFTAGNSDEGRVLRRLGSYTDPDRVKAAKSSAQGFGSSVARSAVELAGRVSEKRGFDQSLGLRLEASGLQLKPAEWLLIQGGGVLLGVIVFAVISGFGPMALLIGGVIGFAGPYLFLSIRVSRRRAQFHEALPDTLTLVAGSLSAGHSILQAFDTVVKETDGVVKDELGRAIVEARLGVPIEDALRSVAERMDSEDFAWVVMAITVQREIGGDLAEVLRNVAFMLRERERVQRQVRSLSAEGRLSAYILVGLPIAFAAYLLLVRPEYIAVLFTEPVGIAMTAIGIGLMVAGSFWMSRIIKIEV